LIVITGDIIDRRHYNLEVALSLCEHIVKIAPAYYVSGNHEAWSGKYEDIILKLKEVGIKVLEDNSQSIFIRNKKIEIFGIKENSKKSGKLSQETFSALKTYEKYRKNDADLLILLTHRPEHFLTYSSYPFDLIFSGHAHGGQIRLPFIGALFAPDQGFIPKYHGGRYVEDRQTMFLSRGLGNSIFPLRILNRPELILVELSNEYEETSN
ncbi:MAG: metallophosphoesterase, partial [Filifactoraceae bacterium]